MEVVLLVAVTLFSSLLIIQEIPTAKADNVTDAITAGLDWLDRMTYLEINSTHAVALESPSLSFRIYRSDGYWTIFGKMTDTNLPPSATMIRGGALTPQPTTDDLGLITGAVDNEHLKYFFDIDGDGNYNDIILYVEYATMDNTHTRVAGKIIAYDGKGLTLSLQLETTQVIATMSLNAQFTIDQQYGWASRRYTIRPTTKGLADLYVWLATTQFSWLNGQTYQQTRGINYTDRALKLYRTWYGSGYIIDRFDGMYGATLTVRPFAGQYGIPNYPVNPDLIKEPLLIEPADWSTYYLTSPTSYWYTYANVPQPLDDEYHNVYRSTTVCRHMMPDEEWDNTPFQCSNGSFVFNYKSRTGIAWARNQYIANGFEYDLTTYNGRWLVAPGIDVVLGIGTDTKSIRACADMAKYGSNIPYGNGLSTLRQEFIDTAAWDGNGISMDTWHGSPIGWAYPGYGTHNTATYANALTQYYKLTSDETYGAKADAVIGTLLMLQEKIGVTRYSRAQDKSYYRAEFLGAFLPGYSVAYSYGQIDVYSAEWLDLIYGYLDWSGTFKIDPASIAIPCLGNAECTIPSVWALIQYRTTSRTPTTPQTPSYTMPLNENCVAYTDHGGSYGGDGNITVVSNNDNTQYIGGGTGNVYKHTGTLTRFRMTAYPATYIGSGWATIEYEMPFTLQMTAPNWRAKTYFTIPDYYATIASGGNSFTVKVSLYDSNNQLVADDSRDLLTDLQGNTKDTATAGKMFVINNFAKIDSLPAGSYTAKIQFKVHTGGGTPQEISLGYIGDSMGISHDGQPMGLEYFGYDIGWNDNFDDDYMDTSLWSRVQVNNGLAMESGSKLQVAVMRLSGWGQAGYVTANPQQTNGFSSSIDVTSLVTGEEMILQLCTTKVTNSDPHNEANWYRILKDNWDDNIYIQRKINGVKTYLQTTAWTASTGQLKISVANGIISFYENGALKYSEPYALATYDVYVYVYMSVSHACGWNSFDNFAFSPTITFFDHFDAPGTPSGWTPYGSWSDSESKLTSYSISSIIISAASYKSDRTVSTSMNTYYSQYGYGSYAVAQLIVKYVNANNDVFCYLDKNGYLFLTLRNQGSQTDWYAYTGLDPISAFHTFTASIIGQNCKIWIDGTLYIDASNTGFNAYTGQVGYISLSSLMKADWININD